MIEDKIKELEDDLKKEQEKEPSGGTSGSDGSGERSEGGTIMYRGKFFGMSIEERTQFLQMRK